MASSDLIYGKARKDRPKGVSKASKSLAESGAAGEPQPLAARKGGKPPSKNPSRRSHTKSRRGCFTCKTRKIKCDEGQPSCSHCVYRGSACVYPPPPRATEIDGGASGGAGAIRIPAVSGGRIFVPFQPKISLVPSSPSEKLIFTAQEMRFFHHFLTSMKHPLPLGNRTVWVREIPQIAHEYPFLLHAILSLGASEMERTHRPMPLRYDVLKHRGRAISGLNKALDDSKAWEAYGHADAVLATCYALIYQSSRIADGMRDFQVLVQGCALVTDKIQQARLKTVLNVDPDWPRHRIHAGMQHIQANLQARHVALVQSGLDALRDVQASRVLDDEHLFWKACYVTLDQFCSSPVDGYSFSIMRYGMWFHLVGGMLKGLRRPDNGTLLVLIASFMSNMILLKVLIPLQVWPEARGRLPMFTLCRMAQCIEVIDEHISEADRQYVVWAKQVIRVFSDLVPEILHDETNPRLRSSKAAIKLDLQTSAHMFLGDILRLGSEAAAWFEDFVSDMMRFHHVPQPQLIPTTEPTVHSISAASSTTAMVPAPMTSSHSYPSPPTADHMTPSDVALAAQDQDEKYVDPSLLDFTAMDSEKFPFRIFSQLDRGWDDGRSGMDDTDDGADDDNNNTRNEMCNFFHV